MTSEEIRIIRREVFTQTWPVIVQHLFRLLMFLVDTVMIKDLGKTAMAAMGVVGPIFYTLAMIFGGLGAGTVATCARAWGEGDAKKQRGEAAAALSVAFWAGLPAMALGLFFLPLAPKLFAVADAPEVSEIAASYLRIIPWAFPFIFLELAASSILRSCAQTRVPMGCAITANLMNIALNYALIYGNWGFPRMGVAGAAVANVVSLGFQGVATSTFLFTPWSRIRLGVMDMARVTNEAMARLVRVTTPAMIEPVILQSGFLVFTKFVTMLGDQSLAAHRSSIVIESISFMPGYGVSVACAAIVGQYLGAQRPDYAAQGLRESMKQGVALMSVIGLLFFLIPDLLLVPFAPRDDARVLGMAATVLMIAALEQPFMASAMIFGGALRGAGDTQSPLWVGLLCVWGVRVPVAYLLAHVCGLGLVGIWITMVIDWVSRSIVFGLLWRGGRWKTIKL